MKAGPYMRFQYDWALSAAEECEKQAAAFLQKYANYLAQAKKHRDAAARWADGTDIAPLPPAHQTPIENKGGGQ